MSSVDHDIPAFPGIEILGLIGRGGLGEVYEAVRKDADGGKQHLAVKRLIVDRTLPAAVAQRFRREARMMSRLSHPGIVRVEEIVENDGQQLILMEMLRGWSLADLPAGREVPAWVAIAVAVQALEALAYVHAWRDEDGHGGIVHRDVTPGNLFVCADGVVKMLDFGVAKQTAREQLQLTQALTRSGMLVGTLNFLSPEQARCEPLDARSDLYQLAGTLWYLLTRTPPHGRGGPADILAHAERGEPVTLATSRTDLDPELLRCLGRALEPDRERRFGDAAAMLEAARALAARHPEANVAGLARWVGGLDRAVRDDTKNIGARAESSFAAGTPLNPGDTIGRYMILSLVGRGGMGEVFAAYDPDLERKVAIKLLRPGKAFDGRAASERQERLMREAQAMARVAHPNVIPVFDVGTFRDRIFIAMELVEGGTLRRWLRQKERGWREIVAMLREAGRGLAAAHQSGLVHRDFKPDNVLIGKDGRPRVTDFGLARPSAPETTSIGTPGSANTTGTDSSAGGGTPAYMAPEQHAGHPADLRSDQYSFCVTLYEALYRQRWHEVRSTQAGGQGKRGAFALPTTGAVPGWVARIVFRGLSEDPAERYPTFDELLDELGKDPVARRRRRLASAGLVALVALAAFGAHRLSRREAMMCRGADAKLAGVWDDAVKERAKQAFLATGKSYAAQTWALTEKALDRYTHDWVAMHTEACEATRVRGEQAEDVMSLRMICLDQSLSDVSALTRVLASADVGVVDRAAQAAAGLPSLSACSNVAALKAGVRLPDDPKLRAEIDDLNRKMSEARAAQLTGKTREELTLASEVAAKAEALHYRPLQARALLLTGLALAKLGDNKRAEEHLRRSVALAVAAGDVATEAEGLAQLLFLVGYVDGRRDEAPWLDELTRAALERLGGSDKTETWRLNAVAAIASNAGDPERALALFRQAVETAQRVPGGEHYQLGTLLSNEAEALLLVGSNGEAEAALERAIAIEERTIGPQHPELGYPLTQMAQALMAEGRYDDALPFAERSLAVRAHGAPGQGVADSLDAMASCRLAAGKNAEARKLLDRSLALRAHEQGTNHLDYAATLELVGEAQTASGDHAGALASYERAIAIVERLQGKEGLALVTALTGLGKAYLSRGDAAHALVPLERAARIADARKAPPSDSAAAYFALAQALWPGSSGRARAQSALVRARQESQRARNPRLGQQIDKWSAEHSVAP